MSKKGAVLTILLIWILILIGIVIYRQSVKQNVKKPENLPVNGEEKQEELLGMVSW